MTHRIAVAVTLALLCSSVRAQEASSEPPAALTPEEQAIAAAGPKTRISLSMGAEYTAGSFSDISGDLDVLRLSTDLTITHRLGLRRQLSVSVSQERSQYDFDDATGIVPADPADRDPLSDAQSLSITPTLGGREADGFSWFVLGSVEWAGEPGAVFDDSVTFALGGGASWQINDELRLGVGVIGATRIEDNAIVIPFPIVEWAFAEDWTLSVGAQGAGGALTYRAREDLTLALEVGFENRNYRLDDDNAFSNGVFQDRTLPIALAASWSPSEQITLTGRVGALAWGEAEFLDSGGNRVNREDRDAAFLIGLDLRFAF